ncbi:MAG: hypothetical protein H7145_10715 [Akkermansiaceae bacterium]|nr:hypothetical protein [Armatimonadota bacterium]
MRNLFTTGEIRQSALRRIATLTAIGAVLSTALTLPAQAQFTDRDYVGINNATGTNTDPNYANATVIKMNAVGFGTGRMGMDQVGGRYVGDTFVWGPRDAVVQKYLDGGVKIACVLGVREHTDAGANYDQWKANFRNFCRNVMNRYRGKIFYYIVDNEPDLSYGGGQKEPQNAQWCIDMTRIAFEEARSIDGNIKIESPPTMSPESDLLRQMIQGDIGSVCDFIGTHVYGAQIDEGRMGRPWEWLNEYGTTRKPISVSEAGVPAYWAPAGIDGQEWRRRWQQQWYVSMKRYGYAQGMLFSLTGGESNWEYYDYFTFAPLFGPLDFDLRNKAFRKTGLENPGFESANDVEYGWHVVFPVDSASRPTWAQFPTNDSSQARSGNGYLRLDSTTNTPYPGVRRVVNNLVPGRAYTAKVWAHVTGNAVAGMGIDGTQVLNGSQAFGATTRTTNSWQELSVSFTPTNPFAVITLFTDGYANSGSVVKFDDVSLVEGGASVIPFGINIGIKANGNGRFVSSHMGDSQLLMANWATGIGSWERFRIVGAGNGNVGILCLDNNKYVSMDNNRADKALRATWADNIGSWETFQWVDLGNQKFALKSPITGKYVASDLNDRGILKALWADNIGSWEQFEWAQTP